jgi:8-oxo-dGTP pyrophosphatase MutT (NUDIX family)
VSLIERLSDRVKLDAKVKPPDDGRRRAAVAAVLRDVGSPSVLLMQRAVREGDPWSGHISLPGGGHDARDADLLATAIRETDEELGIDLGAARLLGNLPLLSPFTSGPMGVEVTPFVFVAREPLEPRPGPEAVAAFWLPLDLAASGALDATYTYPGTDRTFKSWNYEGHVIWGLTWRILGDLIALTARP